MGFTWMELDGTRARKLLLTRYWANSISPCPSFTSCPSRTMSGSQSTIVAPATKLPTGRVSCRPLARALTSSYQLTCLPRTPPTSGRCGALRFCASLTTDQFIMEPINIYDNQLTYWTLTLAKDLAPSTPHSRPYPLRPIPPVGKE